MKHLKTYKEIINENNKNKIEFIGVEYSKKNDDKIKELGYNPETGIKPYNVYDYIWIYIKKWPGYNINYSNVYYGDIYNPKYDLLLDISEIPKREDLDEYVKFLNTSNKLGVF